MGTALRVSKHESDILKQEIHLLDNGKGISQSSEETDYDLNQVLLSIVLSPNFFKQIQTSQVF